MIYINANKLINSINLLDCSEDSIGKFDSFTVNAIIGLISNMVKDPEIEPVTVMLPDKREYSGLLDTRLQVIYMEYLTTNLVKELKGKVTRADGSNYWLH